MVRFKFDTDPLSSHDKDTVLERRKDSTDVETAFQRILFDYPDCFQDAKRFENLLLDVLLNDMLSVSLLCAANEIGITEAIRREKELTSMLSYRYIRRLMIEKGLTQNNAAWSVRMWFQCYGVSFLGKPCVMEGLLADTGVKNTTEIRLDDIAGQKKNVQVLRIMVEAAAMRGEPLEHILISALASSGRSALALAVAHETGKPYRIVSGKDLQNPGELVAVLTDLYKDEVLIVSDIDRSNMSAMEELLPSALSRYDVDVTLGKGPKASTIHLDFPHFTMISITSDDKKLPKKIRDEFSQLCVMEPYTEEDIAWYIQNEAKKIGMTVESEAALRIASHSNNRIMNAKHLLSRVRDFAIVQQIDEISKDYADYVLSRIV